MRLAWVGVTTLVGLVLGCWGTWRLWPRTLECRPTTLLPVWERVGERQILTLPGRFLVAEIGSYDDELFAYLMFQYLRGARALKGAELLLTYRRAEGGLVYLIQVRLENDLIGSLTLLAQAQKAGLIGDFESRYVDENTLRTLQYQTQVFVTAYNLPTNRNLEQLSRPKLIAYVRRFVRFKSVVDPRIRRKLEPVPRPLTRGEAHRLAADIVTIADFYSLPLEFFLGIGAMENNFMNVKGDLQHAIWKRRTQTGDIVLKRQAGRVLVLNPAAGVWQITRETLRYIHNLYLADHRNYSVLPERLRPPKELRVDEVEPDVLTTYAGLLFRQLLDQFHGDVATAVGAYNGGPGNPNSRYEEGVRLVAMYARGVMQQAAVLQGPVAGARFLRSGR